MSELVYILPSSVVILFSFMCMDISYIYVSAPNVCSVQGAQTEALYLQELELQVFVSNQMGAGN